MKFSAERMVGGTNEQREKESLWLREVFEHQNGEQMADIEVEKPHEVIECIALANEMTASILAKYGIPRNDVDSDKIHVIKEGAWPEHLAGSAAIFQFIAQGIAVRDKQPEISLVHDLTHEILHFKSYLASQITLRGDLDNYRIGAEVTTRDGKTILFKNLNEAITEELSYRATQDPLFQKTFDAELKRIEKDIKHYSDAVTDDGIPLFTDQTYYVEIGKAKEDGSTEIYSKELSYPEERKALKELVEKLYERNKDSFQDAEEVFALFVQNAFRGDLLKVGRLIEETFGIGTLRKIAESDSGDDFLRFVSSL